ncbi:DDE-type integrase/transposase/recombinase [Rhizobium sp. 57MFTsu3.2]|uniref:DDE-type integrase/transposase/recombinase n=1 Tax=Rhizobium sp. 57MFTsu3.2 TaxID=1048681 RepID=UPI00146EC331|nr:DDE-type integrase/transposase/recombinase [Rhizobium sp. 57MFTsu3.2]NMN71468.1 putative transposase [Rhizobium sp. 57MFTsu3.2]
MSKSAPTYENHRFPIEIVARAIWLYFRFNVSLREVEELMLERGVVVSCETIRRWRRLGRKPPSHNDVWHLDELVVKANGQKCWLWKRMITDKLRSYKAAARQVMPGVEHRSHKGLNNRAENSHLPFRKRERTRQGFRSIGSLQQFVSIFSTVRNLFVPHQAIRSAPQSRTHRRRAMGEWNAVSLQIA